MAFASFSPVRAPTVSLNALGSGGMTRTALAKRQCHNRMIRATMLKRKKASATERLGVNFVRDVVERHNCVFKEVHHEQDYGHDAFVLLVDDEAVLPAEVALQIKAGKSYCTPTSCRIPASKAHLDFWRNHPLSTYGVVYDPSEGCAYWINLTKTIKLSPRNEFFPSAITFEKAKWNWFDSETFPSTFFSRRTRKTTKTAL